MSNEDRAQVAALGRRVQRQNEEEMVELLVPTRHARRAELAVVLAELAEAWGQKVDMQTELPWYRTARPGYWGMEIGDTWLTSSNVGPTEDPLEAARLALAHVRGQE